MTPHEIRPKQLRALLLLLVLVPLIPTALMVSFMMDSFGYERIAALNRISELHADVLTSVLKRADAAEPLQENAKRAIADLEGSTDAHARVIVGGNTLEASKRPTWGTPTAQASMPGHPQATIQMYLSSESELDASMSAQRRSLITIGVSTALSVLAIAGMASFGVLRQIKLSELKNTSVATVAHELRTPLASIRMLVDTLREGRYRGEAQLREYLDLVAAENERLTRLAEDFLTFSRLERGKTALRMESVHPGEVARQAIGPLKPRLEAPGCSFELHEAPALPAVRGDRDALAQVLANLIDNALKYTEAEKSIALRISAAPQGVTFTVEDNGIGLDRHEREEIFRPFHQGDRKLSRTRQGCGLGLAIVRRIVDAHDGRISVSGEPGRGSAFTITIPAA